MFCSGCGNKLKKDEKFCEKCGKEVGEVNESIAQKSEQKKEIGKRKKGKGCLIIIIVLISLFVLFVIYVSVEGKSLQKKASGVSSESEYITLEEFNAIKTDMTHEEVASIVGSSGKVTDELGDDLFKITIVTWYGNGLAGSNANVTFANGKVSKKAKLGLK